MIQRLKHFLAVLTVTGTLAACGGSSGPGSGTLNLAVTDAAVDSASAVVVEFTGVELQPRDGQRIQIPLPAPRQIDLLALNGGGSTTLLQGVEVPAGTYNFIRLMVNAGRSGSDSFITLDDGTTNPLFIPSGDERGLMLNGAFEVPDGGIANFTIDFDLRKSVRAPPGQDGVYLLRPVVRIVNSDAVGMISGTVANERVAVSGCTPAVYVYAGADFVPGDEGSAGAPLTSAQVNLDAATGLYGYTAAFLPPGSYTVAYTCDAALDDPETDDAVVFQSPTSAVVLVNQTTTVDFPIAEVAP